MQHTRAKDVRFAVTHALGAFSNNLLAIESLVKLSEDPDEDVRNWAMFALASQSEANSQALRELFIRHLDDPNPEVQEEAIAGLAKRKDPRAALPLLRLMESGSYYFHHHHDFIALVGEDPDLDDWGTDDFIDALYSRFSDILPSRIAPESNPNSSDN